MCNRREEMIKFKMIPLFICIIFLFSACKPGVTPTVVATITVEPILTPTETPIPISELDLDEILIVDGDLPPSFEASQIRNKLGDISNDAPEPDNFFSRSISRNNTFGGIVDVLLYEDISKVTDAYKISVEQMPGNGEIVEVGEIGEAKSNSYLVNTASIAFTRCNAVVVIQLQGTSNVDDVISFAVRLDKRLKNIVCQ